MQVLGNEFGMFDLDQLQNEQIFDQTFLYIYSRKYYVDCDLVVRYKLHSDIAFLSFLIQTEVKRKFMEMQQDVLAF